MEKICVKIVDNLITIAELTKTDEDKEVYVYGLLSLIYTMIPFAVLLLISLPFQRAFEMLLWIFFFLSLRKYAGGFHAKTATMCFLYSIFLGLSALIICSGSPRPSAIIYFSCILGNTVPLLIQAPLTHKDFSSRQKHICKLKLGSLILFLSAMLLLFPSLQIYYLHALTSTTILCIAHKMQK